MLTRRIATLFIATALFISFTAAQMAGAGMRAGKMPQKAAVADVIKKLNLTDEQKKEIEKLRFDFQKQQVAQQAKIHTAQIELRELLSEDNPDRAAIQKKVDEIARLRVQSAMDRFDHWQAVKKILTPEQQKIWREELRSHFWNFLGRGPMHKGEMKGPMHPMRDGM
ncbi:MAG: Spy/CpxP family protein refolding chaperone [Bacteroidota bacterium]